MESTLPPIALSALQHWRYCPRQYALIHQEQAFEDNVLTQRGQAVHARVDQPSVEGSPWGSTRIRALPLYHDTLGLIGKADLVEILADGTPYPIEYKHGRQRLASAPAGADELQLAAQALCLEHMLKRPVPEGAIYHASSKRRQVVAIGLALREQVVQAIAGIRAIEARAQLPPPVADARCRNCSLIDLCQPDLLVATDRLRALRARLFDPAD